MRSRGVSELLATILLIALVIVGGVAVYVMFLSNVRSTSSTSQLEFVAISLSGASDSMSITVRNTGTVAVSSLALQINNYGQTGCATVTYTGPAQLGPGAQATFSGTPCSVTLVSGDEYLLVASGIANGGPISIALPNQIAE